MYLSPENRTCANAPIGNPYERAHRLMKVNALLELLIGLEARVEQVEQLERCDWLLFANAANVKPPSGATISLVLESLRRIEATPNA